MEDEPGRVWEVLEQMISNLGAGYEGEKGGIGFVESVGLVAVAVAGAMGVGNVLVGSPDVRRLLKVTLDCCVGFDGGVEDEGVKESVEVIARGLLDGEGDEEEAKEVRLSEERRKAGAKRQQHIADHRSPTTFYSSLRFAHRTQVAFKATLKWMGDEDALDLSLRWKYWRGVCEVCRGKDGGREMLRDLWNDNSDEEFRAFVLGYFKGEGDFSWVLDVGRGSSSLKEWCVLNNKHRWVVNARDKDWSGVMESSLEEAVKAEVRLDNERRRTGPKRSDGNINGNIVHANLTPSTRRCAPLSLRSSQGKRERMRMLSIAKLASKAEGKEGSDIGNLLAVGHAQDMMDGSSDGPALGTSEISSLALAKIKAGSDVVKHTMIAMACARAMGGESGENEAVGVWKAVVELDGEVWDKASKKGGDEERDEIVRGSVFYSTLVTYLRNDGEYDLEGEGGRIERVIGGGKGGKGIRRAVVMARMEIGGGEGNGNEDMDMDERQ